MDELPPNEYGDPSSTDRFFQDPKREGEALKWLATHIINQSDC
jgi:hypothetical protein